jgi:hypothetical protein
VQFWLVMVRSMLAPPLPLPSLLLLLLLIIIIYWKSTFMTERFAIACCEKWGFFFLINRRIYWYIVSDIRRSLLLSHKNLCSPRWSKRLDCTLKPVWEPQISQVKIVITNNMIDWDFFLHTLIWHTAVAYPGILLGGFNKFSWGHRVRERESGGGNFLVRGSAQFANELNLYSY